MASDKLQKTKYRFKAIVLDDGMICDKCKAERIFRGNKTYCVSEKFKNLWGNVRYVFIDGCENGGECCVPLINSSFILDVESILKETEF